MTISMIAHLPVGSEIELPEGWTEDGVRHAIAESVIERHRYPDETSVILARHGEVGEALFPSTTELAEMGVDVELLAIAFNHGLAADGLDGLVREHSPGTVNWALGEMVETARLAEIHPDSFDRVMHAHGECACA